jgi:hypothetical protein
MSDRPAIEDVALRAALADAARALLILVKAHRTAGDGDLEAALARVEGVLRTYDTQRAR